MEVERAAGGEPDFAAEGFGVGVVLAGGEDADEGVAGAPELEDEPADVDVAAVRRVGLAVGALDVAQAPRHAFDDVELPLLAEAPRRYQRWSRRPALPAVRSFPAPASPPMKRTPGRSSKRPAWGQPDLASKLVDGVGFEVPVALDREMVLADDAVEQRLSQPGEGRHRAFSPIVDLIQHAVKADDDVDGGAAANRTEPVVGHETQRLSVCFTCRLIERTDQTLLQSVVLDARPAEHGVAVERALGRDALEMTMRQRQDLQLVRL